MVILVLTLLLKALVVVGEGDAEIPNLSGFSPAHDSALGSYRPLLQGSSQKTAVCHRTPCLEQDPSDFLSPITPGPGEEERGVLAKNGVG